jgi:hypothetical protein
MFRGVFVSKIHKKRSIRCAMEVMVPMGTAMYTTGIHIQLGILKNWLWFSKTTAPTTVSPTWAEEILPPKKKGTASIWLSQQPRRSLMADPGFFVWS